MQFAEPPKSLTTLTIGPDGILKNGGAKERERERERREVEGREEREEERVGKQGEVENNKEYQTETCLPQFLHSYKVSMMHLTFDFSQFATI